MAERVKVGNVRIICCDFPQDNYVVICSDDVGRQYDMGHLELNRAQAGHLADRVRATGTIDPDLWIAYAPYGTEEWYEDGHDIRDLEDERHGYV